MSAVLVVAAAGLAAVLAVALARSRRQAARALDLASGARLDAVRAEHVAALAESLARNSFDDAVGQVLERLGRLLGADRCYLALVQENRSRFDVTHEWCSERAEPEIQGAKDLLVEDFPFLAREPTDSGAWRVDAASGVEPPPGGVRPSLTAPLVARGEVLGWIGVEAVGGSKTWSEADLEVLRQVAMLVAGSLVRQRAEDELRRLTRAKEDADRSSRAKSEFLANVSHEIRTPVNAVIGNAHLLSQTGLTDRQRSYLTKIRSSSQSLLGLINNLFDLSELEAGRLTLETVDFELDTVLDGVTGLLDAKARDRGLELVRETGADVPGSLVGDPVRLEQVLVILGSNAVKFTERGQVALRVERLRMEGEEVVLRFAVRDTGIGIAPDQLDRLFTPFTQVDDSTTRPFGGAGLGLAIARRLVEMMRGEISATSEPGIGSEFAFTVRVGVQPATDVVGVREPGGLRGLRALVVDDSRTDQRVLCEMLHSFSFTAVAVGSGEAALRELSSAQRGLDGKPFQLVLVDWKMPSMDGFELARKIRRNRRLTSQPAIILVTGHGREDVVDLVEDGCFDGFLLKPVEPSLLFDAIVAAVGHRGRSHAVAGVAVEAEPPAFGSARVLLVDDNVINQELAQELLTELGVIIDVAGDGQEAVDAVRQRRYDLVLMDVQMPVMDGFQATASIRASGEGADVPIVAMTAHAMSGDRERCLAAGMDDYLSKPIDTERLDEVLERWLGGRSRTPPRAEPAATVAVSGHGFEGLSGIDVEAGVARLGGNERLFRKLLLDFLKDYRGVVGTIRTAIDLQHTDSVVRMVHTLKGVAATIGADAVHAAAVELEAGISSAETADLDGLLETLGAALEPVLEGLARLEKEPSGADRAVAEAPTKPLDPAQLESLLRAMSELLTQGDPEASTHLEPLARSLAGTELEGELETLCGQIDNFDLDEAAGTVERMARHLKVHLA